MGIITIDNSTIVEVQTKSHGFVIVGMTKDGVVTYNGITSWSFKDSFIKEVTEALEIEGINIKKLWTKIN